MRWTCAHEFGFRSTATSPRVSSAPRSLSSYATASEGLHATRPSRSDVRPSETRSRATRDLPCAHAADHSVTQPHREAMRLSGSCDAARHLAMQPPTHCVCASETVQQHSAFALRARCAAASPRRCRPARPPPPRIVRVSAAPRQRAPLSAAGRDGVPPLAPAGKNESNADCHCSKASNCGTWPTPASRTSFAPGMARAAASPSLG